MGEGMGNLELWRGIQASHLICCVSATNGIPGMAWRRRGGGLLYGVYRMTCAAWNTIAGIQVLVFVDL